MAKLNYGLRSSISSPNALPKISNEINAVRVKAIILDDATYPELFKRYGEWASIGVVFFSTVQDPRPTEFDENNVAFPLFSNIKQYPLENEIVYLISLPSTNVLNNTNDRVNYYFNPLNLWNSIHHNAIPDNVWSKDNTSQQDDYSQSDAGVTRKVKDGSTEIELGNTFQEKSNIQNLQPYEGDHILEGRWGQSIRFGSTVTNAKIKNTWSETGKNGDPIIIIRNGQADTNTDAWIPTVEDINKDKSSLFITSNQKIPIQSASENYSSYDTAPISPKEYTKNQIILNSGRLLFNANNDSILLSAKNSINLNSAKTINIDSSEKTVINSPEIYLGGKDATEAVLLGDKTYSLLKSLLNELLKLSNSLPTVGTPTPGVPNAAVITTSTQLSVTLSQLLLDLEFIKSKQNKTK
jgi:hypothetical protein